MSALRFHYRPKLDKPVMLLSFLGWNDAAESASGAIRYLRRRARTERLAEIDPDNFFVFTEDRPLVRLRDGQTREIRWPRTDFTPARMGPASRDFILGLGTEPHLRWKAFAGHVLDVVAEMGVVELVTVGALLADTPHTRPVPLTGGAHPVERMRELGFEPSSYQGPTGIVGAIGELCRSRDIAHVSLWASVPHYVAGGAEPPRHAGAADQAGCDLPPGTGPDGPGEPVAALRGADHGGAQGERRDAGVRREAGGGPGPAGP